MSPGVPPLAPGTRLVHIGPPKTGTSSLQSALHLAREKLAEYGVVFPGNERHPIGAVHAVTGRPPLLGHKQPNLSSWTALAEQVIGAGDQRVVVSSEFFADGDDEAVKRVVDDLGGPLVHVVVTLRPLTRILPSQWQQYVQNGLRMDYATWLDTMFTKPPLSKPTPTFWQRHHHDRLIERWSAVVGPQNITVILVDQSQPDMLLRTFEALLAVPDGLLVPEEGLTNRSLTYGETEMIRLLNIEFRRCGWPENIYPRFIKYGAIMRMRSEHQPLPEEQRNTTPAWALDRAAEIGAEAARRISGMGVRIIGDIGSLAERPGSSAEASPQAEAAPPMVSAEAACQALLAAIEASGATGETTKLEERQVRDLDAATLVRVLQERGMRRARRTLRRVT